jgi:hypothetical protein
MQNDIKASKTAVFKAANTLLAQGIQPSVQKVRRFLGGGNVAGISRYLKEWRKTLENTPNEAKTGQKPCPEHLEIQEVKENLARLEEKLNRLSANMKTQRWMLRITWLALAMGVGMAVFF